MVIWSKASVEKCSQKDLSGPIVAPGWLPPAALTRMSTVPQAFWSVAAAASQEAWSVTSAGSGIAVPPSARIASAISLATASRRPTTATLAPAAARPLHMQEPRTPVPPVTTATLPVRSNMAKPPGSAPPVFCARNEIPPRVSECGGCTMRGRAPAPLAGRRDGRNGQARRATARVCAGKAGNTALM